MVRIVSMLFVLLYLACGPGSEGEMDATSAAPEPTPRFLVLQKLGNSVAFYTLDGKLTTTIPVGKNPHEMILSEDGRWAYVTDYGARGVEEEAEGGTTVTIIDVANQEKAGVMELGEFRRPHGIDISPGTGQVFVTTENPNRLLIIDTKSLAVVRDYATNGESSHMVTRSPDGRTAYVSNIGTRNISVIDLETGGVELIPVGERPEGSDITKDGKTLYVACRESHVISVIDTEKNAVVSEVATGKGPNRVRLTPDEKLLVYSLVHDGQIGIADAGSGEEIATIDLDGSPVSLQLSRNGEWALTAAQSDDAVFVVSIAERKIVQRFVTAEGAGPDPVLEIGR